MQYTVFKEPPCDFSPTVEVASCFCEFEDKILLLRRHKSRPQGNTWCIPAGKIEAGEDARTAVVREIWEETGLEIDDPALTSMGKLYMRHPNLDYVLHMFRKQFKSCPAINLGLDEHDEAKWIAISDAGHLPMIAGGKESIEYYQMLLDKTDEK